jgi:hypothetical protein
MPDNPYTVGGAGASGPSYAAPLLDWQGMAGGIGDAWSKARQPQQPGQPPQSASIWQQIGGGPSGQTAGPMNIRSPAQMQGLPPQGGQQPVQGWGQRLQQWLQQGQQPGMANPGGPGGQFGGPQPMVPTDPRAPTGLY